VGAVFAAGFCEAKRCDVLNPLMDVAVVDGIFKVGTAVVVAPKGEDIEAPGAPGIGAAAGWVAGAVVVVDGAVDGTAVVVADPQANGDG
jgi:hypothetical protein